MPGRCPAARAFEGCAVRRLRPSWDLAVVRRRAGGVLQRGGPKGQQSLCEGLPCVVCRVVFPWVFIVGSLVRRLFKLWTVFRFS